MSARKRVVVLISGRGTNMMKLVEATEERDFPAEIVGVLSDDSDAPGLKFAEARNLPAGSVPRSDHPTREEHEAAISRELERLGADIVCLAGFMRLLSPKFVERWAGRMINIHPALLPSFRGLDTHRRALDAGVRLHGCTVHFVTPEVDAGPIIAQAAVPVLVGDSEHSLAARVLKAEHELYPLALRMLAAGKVALADGRATFSSLIENERSAGRLFSPSTFHDLVDLEALARVTP